MKLGKNVLLEIVEILRVGLTEGVDISDLLRELDLEQESDLQTGEEVLVLSRKFLASKGRVF